METPESDPPGDPALAEALRLPVALWADLPAPSSLRVRTSTGRVAWLTASRGRLAADPRGEPAFGPNEYEALFVARLEGRARDIDVDAWIDRKLEAPGWVLTTRVAFGSALDLYDREKPGRVRASVLGMRTMGELLTRAGLEALEVVVEEQVASLVSAQVTEQELASL